MGSNRIDQPIRHGTQAGFQAHRRRGEYPCEPCTTAQACDAHARAIRCGRTRSVRIPVELVGAVLQALDVDRTDVRERLVDHLGMPVVQACVEKAVARG